MATVKVGSVDIEVTELFESRKIVSAETTTAELKYVVKLPLRPGGDYLPLSNDHQYALDAVIAESPTYFYPRTVQGSITRRSIEVSPINDLMWQATVLYAGVPVEAGQNQFRFDTTGGTEHIVHDRNTVFAAAPSIRVTSGTLATDYDAVNYPSCNGLIGNTGDSVEGCDIVVPVFAFSEVHTKPVVWFSAPLNPLVLIPYLVHTSYEIDLELLTGSVNIQTFRGRSPGEVLFLGVASDPIGNDLVQLNFKFASSPNRTDLKIGDQSYPSPNFVGPPSPPDVGSAFPMKNIPKKGWENLSVRSTTVPTTGTGPVMSTMAIAGVYVHEVYPYGDFSLLEIGL